MNKIWIVPIERIPTRYTTHWYEYVPKQMQANIDNFIIEQIDIGYDTLSNNTPGAFFNFADTMKFKSKQAEVIASLFSDGKIKSGDVFLYTDYWNPTAHNVRYMADLLGIKIKLVGICHAGAWDPADILGQTFKDKQWSYSLEKSLDALYDVKIFATQFSKSLYEKTFGVSDNNIATGFPMEYYTDILPNVSMSEKEDIVLFPHRKSPEKHLDLFNAVATRLPQYKFLVALDETKNKEEYHELLYKSKLCFSASLQETLGISIGIEALMCGCDVIVPDRLSYKEMFFDDFKYPSNIANDVIYTQEDVDYLVNLIDSRMKNPTPRDKIFEQREHNFTNYFTGTKFYNVMNSL